MTLAVLGIVGIGVAARLTGYFGDVNALWWDEASWVRQIGRGHFGIRPPGFAQLSFLLIEADPTAQVVRAPSVVAGILTLPAFFWLLHELELPKPAQLMGLLLLAVHPWAVSYSKEFKPYALELFVHVLALACLTAFVRKPHLKWGLVAGAAVSLSLPFSWTAGALLPPFVLAATRATWKAGRRKATAFIIAAAGLCAAALFFLLEARLDKAQAASSYWANKYGVFFEGEGQLAHAKWLLEKTAGLAKAPWEVHSELLVSEAWAQGYSTLGALLVLVGVVDLAARRRWLTLTVLLGPWLSVIAANVLDLWVYGAFRTNLFLLAYPMTLSVVGLGSVSRLLARRRSSRPVSWVAAAMIVLPLLPLDPAYYRIKDRATGAESTSLPQALELIGDSPEFEAHRQRLVMDAHACASFAYYSRIHPTWKDVYQRDFHRRLLIDCGHPRLKKFLAQVRRRTRRPVWVLVSNTNNQGRIAGIVGKWCEIDQQHQLPTGDVLLHCRGPK